MTSAIPLITTINGKSTRRTISPRSTLADFLRDDMGLTGTKVSCEMQVCGVCTVLVDGLPVSACTFLAADAEGRELTTIEGLADGNGLHPIQAAFVDNFALQCGFCTPGFVMMAKALLDEQPNPNREQIADYFDGNVCRCTGYEPILEAVIDAAERLREKA